MKNPVLYRAKMSEISENSRSSLLIYDSILISNPAIKKWLKKFPYKIAVKAGESLKTLKSLESVLVKIENLKMDKSSNMQFIAMGGGSVGDFVGFLSSVYMRGRNLIHIPSTWLAAIDSSHGGKSALNVKGTKNQIGSFHQAQKIYICHEILINQPNQRLAESFGELFKMALLKDNGLFSKIENSNFKFNKKTFLKLLPEAIKLKYEIVKKDPLEKKGLRRVLNLGHTLGHVIEAKTGWPHGICVLLGIEFSVRWSLQKQYLDKKEALRILSLIQKINSQFLLSKKYSFTSALELIDSKNTLRLLRGDKKALSDNKMDFIFLSKIGVPIRKPVLISEIAKEIKRQKMETYVLF